MFGLYAGVRPVKAYKAYNKLNNELSKNIVGILENLKDYFTLLLFIIDVL